MAHLDGIDDGSGYGVTGTSTNVNGVGVEGTSKEGHGVSGTGGGMKKAGVYGTAANPQCYAILGETTTFLSTIKGLNSAGIGDVPNDVTECGVWGDSSSGPGVSGTSAGADGVFGQGKNGIHGRSTAAGSNTAGNGVWGEGGGGFGVFGSSSLNDGVHGTTQSAQHAAVSGLTGSGTGVSGISGTGTGVHGASSSGFAGEFDGNVQVSGIASFKPPGNDRDVVIIMGGTIQAANNVMAHDVMLSGADCAEEFDAREGAQLEPGTVVILDETGALSQSNEPYDRRVAGVISGAGEFRPGVILDRRSSSVGRVLVALVGKAYCKADATTSPIRAGDLLTTSTVRGCAMKAIDPSRAFGAVLGKALAALDSGCALIPILVTLQ